MIGYGTMGLNFNPGTTQAFKPACIQHSFAQRASGEPSCGYAGLSMDLITNFYPVQNLKYTQLCSTLPHTFRSCKHNSMRIKLLVLARTIGWRGAEEYYEVEKDKGNFLVFNISSILYHSRNHTTQNIWAPDCFDMNEQHAAFEYASTKMRLPVCNVSHALYVRQLLSQKRIAGRLNKLVKGTSRCCRTPIVLYARQK